MTAILVCVAMLLIGIVYTVIACVIIGIGNDIQDIGEPFSKDEDESVIEFGEEEIHANLGNRK